MLGKQLLEQLWRQSGAPAVYLQELANRAALTHADAEAHEGLSELPSLFCEMHGGDCRQVLPIRVAWQLLRHAARILDDVVDDPTRLSATAGKTTLNYSTGLIFSAGLVLNELEAQGVTPGTAGDIRKNFYQVLLQTAGGQHLDLTSQQPDLAQMWQIAEAKSGAFCGLITWAGARLGTDREDVLSDCCQFGRKLGVLDQIRDDLADLWSTATDASDLRRVNNWGLPAAYALSVLPPDKKKLLVLLITHFQGGDAPDTAEAQARQIIIDSGAGAYLTIKSTLIHGEAMQLLEKMAMTDTVRSRLMALLNRPKLH